MNVRDLIRNLRAVPETAEIELQVIGDGVSLVAECESITTQTSIDLSRVTIYGASAAVLDAPRVSRRARRRTK